MFKIDETHKPTMWRALALAAILAVLYLGFHGGYGLFDVDEAIFTQATTEMVRTETYSMPSYNGEPRYQKPPLIYWLQTAAMQLFGTHSLYAARLPSALFALGAIGLLGWGIARLTGNARWGLISAAVLGLNISFTVIGRAATADAVLNFFMLALALWCLQVIYGKRWRWSWLVTGVLIACGLLAKGPVAGLSAALVVVPLLVVRADRWELIKRLEPIKVVAVALLGMAPWVWLLHLEGRLEFFTQFLLVENLQRFGSGFSNTHSGSPFYYLIVLAIGFMPWVFFLPRIGWEVGASFRTRLASTHVKEALPALCMVWAVGIIGLFTFSGTKLAHYIVPAYPALAILVGWWFSRRKHPRFLLLSGWWAGLQLLVIALLLAVLPWVLTGLRNPQPDGLLGWLLGYLGVVWPPQDALTWEVLQQEVQFAFWPFWLAAAALAGDVLGGYIMLRNKLWHGLEVMAGGMAVFILMVIIGIVPAVWAYSQKPLAELAEEMKAAPEWLPVIHLGLHKPSVLYLSGRSFVKLERPLQLPSTLAPGQRALVLTEVEDMAGIQQEMARRGTVQVQSCRGGYCLLLVDRAN